MQCPGANRSMQQQPMMRLNARPMGVCPGASVSMSEILETYFRIIFVKNLQLLCKMLKI